MNTTDEILKRIADKLIEQIESFDGEWKKPFFSANGGFPTNIVSKKKYNGVNAIILWLSADHQCFTSSVWGTFDQWKSKGKSIKKGEKGTSIIFFKPCKYDKEVKDENGVVSLEQVETLVMRHYVVFNACQMAEYQPEVVQTEETPLEIVEEVNQFKTNFLDKTGIKYSEGRGRACYIPNIDEVYLPSIEQFSMQSEYIPTACHEFIHSTGAKHRLNRDFSGRFGDESYAFEELIADIGAGFLSANFGKSYIFQNNNVAYLQGWAKVLKDKPRAILTACSHAQKATDYLLKLANIDGKAIDEVLPCE